MNIWHYDGTVCEYLNCLYDRRLPVMFKGRPAALDTLVMVADHLDNLLSSVFSSHMKVAKKDARA